MLQFIIRNSLVAIQLPLARDGHGCPKLNAQSFARMRNWQSVHMARTWCIARDSAVLEGLDGERGIA